MFLLISIKKFLIFPVLFVEMFFAPSESVVSAIYASVASPALHKYRSFELHRTLHNCLDVLVEEVQNLLAVLGLSVVTGG